MSIGITTEATCSDPCWYAREDVCRCSCGGKNHGILRTPGGGLPPRTRRVYGERYELAGIVGYSLEDHGCYALHERAARDQADQINGGAAAGRAGLTKREWAPDERHRVFYAQASKQQMDAWSELRPYMADTGSRRPFMIWRMIESPPPPEPTPATGQATLL